MAAHDLVIRSGTVVDGTGAPRRTADVAVDDGVITEVGEVDGRGTRELDDLRDPAGQRTELHPSHVLGQLWSLEELFAYGQRNFDCDYTFWHFREFPNHGEYGWPDTRSVILSNPYFYE